MAAAPAPAQAAQPTAEDEWFALAEAALKASRAGDPAKAEPLAQRALHVARTKFDPAHPAIAASLDFLAVVQERLGRNSEAVLLREEALQRREKASGFSHADTIRSATALAHLYYKSGRLPQAESLFRRLLVDHESRPGADEREGAVLRGNLASVLHAGGKLAEAEEISRKLLAWAEARLGGEDPETLLRLNNLGALLKDRGRLAESAALLERALAARERVLGAEHEDTKVSRSNLAVVYHALGRTEEAARLLAGVGGDDAVSLGNRAGLLLSQGKHGDALVLYRQVLEKTVGRLGREHPDAILALNNVATAERAGGEAASAEAHLREAAELAVKAVGSDHPLTTSVRMNLAGLLKERGRYGEAEALYAQSLLAAEKALGPSHVTTLGLLNNLAALLSAQGRDEEAGKLFERVHRSTKSILGADHPETVASLNNLASSYQARGRFAEAEPLYLQALAAAQRTSPSSEATATALNNLASLYQEQGRLSDAEPLYARAYAMAQASLGKTHQRTLSTANNLALLYERKGDLAKAEPLLLETAETARRTLGEGHPDTLTALSNLASVQDELGRHEASEQLYRRVLAARQSALGAKHPETLKTLNNLAVVLVRQNQMKEASQLLAEAAAGAEALGASHPQAIDLLSNLAFARLVAGDAAGALSPARSAAAGLRARRSLAGGNLYAQAQGERELLATGPRFTLLADAAWTVAPTQPELKGEVFLGLQDAMAGAASQAMVKSAVRRLAAARSAELASLVDEREALSRRWAVLTRTAGADAADAAATGERLRIEQRTAAIDEAIAKRFPDFFALTRSEAVDVPGTQALLAADEAILLATPGPLGTHVVAVTADGLTWVRSDWTEKQVDAAVRKLLWQAGAPVAATPAETMEWEIEAAGAATAYDLPLAHALYGQLVQPVAAALSGKRHLFVAAGGSLSAFPFAMLVTDPPAPAGTDAERLRRTRWFGDAHALVTIPSIQSLRFLKSNRRDERRSGQGFAGFGDPALDGAGEARGAARGSDRGGELPPAAETFSTDSLRRLARLPGTAGELQKIRAALGAPASAVRLGTEANESVFKATDFSRIGTLALATHGLLAQELAGLAEPGLVLTPPRVATAQDDGFLAASEIAALRFSADLVILSACNTAGGDGSSGAAGLSGLARAFFYAGARHLLVSHWPVDDEVAPRITVRILELVNTTSMSRAEALRQAMAEIRADASHDGEASWAHPSAWAPFVLVGGT